MDASCNYRVIRDLACVDITIGPVREHPPTSAPLVLLHRFETWLICPGTYLGIPKGTLVGR
jgi:hypothetical protein